MINDNKKRLYPKVVRGHLPPRPLDVFYLGKPRTHHDSDYYENRAKALIRDDFTCQAHRIGLPECGRRTVHMEIHHIKWLSRGGTHELTNLVTICSDCHDKIHPWRKMMLASGKKKKLPGMMAELPTVDVFLPETGSGDPLPKADYKTASGLVVHVIRHSQSED